MVKTKIATYIENIITFGLADRLKEMERVRGNYAAAGDPTEKSDKKSFLEEQKGKEVTVDGIDFIFKPDLTYEVVGDSMKPKGIYDGDVLLIESDYRGRKPKQGDFVIIKVDNDYYKQHNRKSAVFDTKLRMSLLVAEASMTADDIIEQLRSWHKEILIMDYQKHLRYKYKDSRAFYANSDLVLSITYHNGIMRYSFHPVELICGKVVLRARIIDGTGKVDYKIL